MMNGEMSRTRPIPHSAPAARLLVAMLVALPVIVGVGMPVQADSEPVCRLHGSAVIGAGDSASGNAHTTDWVANLGTGRWRHETPAGDRFDGHISVFGCHSNTGEIANLEGTGSFQGSDAVLTVLAQIEDRTRLGAADHYWIGIFSGTTLVYSTAGPVVDGDFRVTVLP